MREISDTYKHSPVFRWQIPCPLVQLHSIKQESAVFPEEHSFSQLIPLNPGIQLHIPLTDSHVPVLFLSHVQFREQSCPNVQASHFWSHLFDITNFKYLIFFHFEKIIILEFSFTNLPPALNPGKHSHSPVTWWHDLVFDWSQLQLEPQPFPYLFFLHGRWQCRPCVILTKKNYSILLLLMLYFLRLKKCLPWKTAWNKNIVLMYALLYFKEWLITL